MFVPFLSLISLFSLFVIFSFSLIIILYLFFFPCSLPFCLFSPYLHLSLPLHFLSPSSSTFSSSLVRSLSVSSFPIFIFRYLFILYHLRLQSFLLPLFAPFLSLPSLPSSFVTFTSIIIILYLSFFLSSLPSCLFSPYLHISLPLLVPFIPSSLIPFLHSLFPHTCAFSSLLILNLFFPSIRLSLIFSLALHPFKLSFPPLPFLFLSYLLFSMSSLYLFPFFILCPHLSFRLFITVPYSFTVYFLPYFS